MIRHLSILILTLLAACTTSKVEDKNAAWKTSPPKQKQSKQITAEVVQEAPPKTRILPLNARVVSVKNDLRFVLIDFTNSRRPGLEERLNVYRVGQKVAEIKVSGPYLNTTVAADLLAGDARYGDEVKAE